MTTRRSLPWAAALVVTAAAPTAAQTLSASVESSSIEPSAVELWPVELQTRPAHSERSPLLAGLLQAAFPLLPLGYLYAGNVPRGLIPMGVMAVGSTLFLIETVEIIDWTTNDESEGLLYLGLALTAGGYVFGVVDAANVARNRNARLRAAGAALRVVPTPNGVALALSIPAG
ncbi:MAG: hypothetical protein FJ207_03150 [Gemmatimonadetes bacterium]|nr:hypothetical protein [Gemmatimonadota bacterium]